MDEWEKQQMASSSVEKEGVQEEAEQGVLTSKLHAQS
jgi:hypothetical protein